MAAKGKTGSGPESDDLDAGKMDAREQDTDEVGDQEGDTAPPEDDDGSSGVEGAGDPEAKLAALEQKADDAYDKFVRVSADFENYRKRSAREMAEFRKYANESLIRELLPIVDNLERAVGSTDGDGDTGGLVEGVELTLKEILRVFERFVVKPIDATGKPFDPTFHQAVMQEETDDQPENTILRELQRGYTIHDRLLRPTMVVVSKAAGRDEGVDDPDTGRTDDET